MQGESVPEKSKKNKINPSFQAGFYSSVIYQDAKFLKKLKKTNFVNFTCTNNSKIQLKTYLKNRNTEQKIKSLRIENKQNSTIPSNKKTNMPKNSSKEASTFSKSLYLSKSSNKRKHNSILETNLYKTDNFRIKKEENECLNENIKEFILYNRSKVNSCDFRNKNTHKKNNILSKDNINRNEFMKTMEKTHHSEDKLECNFLLKHIELLRKLLGKSIKLIKALHFKLSKFCPNKLAFPLELSNFSHSVNGSDLENNFNLNVIENLIENFLNHLVTDKDKNKNQIDSDLISEIGNQYGEKAKILSKALLRLSDTKEVF